MSGDPEQDYFADGMVEEIITALSRFRWLFVIARNSSFTYKGRAVDVKQVGRELGVRYVLEGSVRKAGNGCASPASYRAATGAHLWADVSTARSKTSSTAGPGDGERGRRHRAQAGAGRDRAGKRKPTESLDAYDYYLRGMAAFQRLDSVRPARRRSLLSAGLITLDPHFAAAHGLAARMLMAQRKTSGWVVDREMETSEAEAARASRRRTWQR